MNYFPEFGIFSRISSTIDHPEQKMGVSEGVTITLLLLIITNLWFDK